jgi:hypothetical protein
MLSSNVCVVFVVKPPAEAVLTLLMIGMEVEYGQAGGRRGHACEEMETHEDKGLVPFYQDMSK